MMNKSLGLLSLCRKAGKLKMGADPCLEAAAGGQAKLILYASDFSVKTKAGLERSFSGLQSPPPRIQTQLTMFDFSQVCGKLTGVVAVADDGFARGLQDLICAENKED